MLGGKRMEQTRSSIDEYLSAGKTAKINTVNGNPIQGEILAVRPDLLVMSVRGKTCIFYPHEVSSIQIIEPDR